jgi:hypothetical protein
MPTVTGSLTMHVSMLKRRSRAPLEAIASLYCPPADRSRRIACDNRSLVDISDDDGPRRDDRAARDGHAWPNERLGSDPSILLEAYGSRNQFEGRSVMRMRCCT